MSVIEEFWNTSGALKGVGRIFFRGRGGATEKDQKLAKIPKIALFASSRGATEK